MKRFGGEFTSLNQARLYILGYMSLGIGILAFSSPFFFAEKRPIQGHRFTETKGSLASKEMEPSEKADQASVLFLLLRPARATVQPRAPQSNCSELKRASASPGFIYIHRYIYGRIWHC
jgi:hypothetical protein